MTIYKISELLSSDKRAHICDFHEVLQEMFYCEIKRDASNNLMGISFAINLILCKYLRIEIGVAETVKGLVILEVINFFSSSLWNICLVLQCFLSAGYVKVGVLLFNLIDCLFF